MLFASLPDLSYLVVYIFVVERCLFLRRFRFVFHNRVSGCGEVDLMILEWPRGRFDLALLGSSARSCWPVLCEVAALR